jgi:hypothetical protein
MDVYTEYGLEARTHLLHIPFLNPLSQSIRLAHIHNLALRRSTLTRHQQIQGFHAFEQRLNIPERDISACAFLWRLDAFHLVSFVGCWLCWL